MINTNNTRSANYIVSLASRTRTFDGSAAKEQIAYAPVVSLDVLLLALFLFKPVIWELLVF